MRKWKSAGNLRDPGIWTELQNMYPTPRGSYKTAPIFTTLGTAGAAPASPGTALGAYAFHDASGTLITYVMTDTKAYYANAANFQAGTFTECTNTATAFTTASTWSVAQYGNFTIAANGVNAVQARNATTAGNFYSLTGSPPIAKIVITQNNAVLLFNLPTAGANCWAASDVGDHTVWDGSAESITYTPILHRPGEITGAVAFRDHIIVFKKSSIYRMQYVGAPIYYTMDLIDDTRGVSSLGAICNCGDFLVFSGAHGATIYDGSGFRDISDGFQLESGLSSLAFNAGTDVAAYFPAESNVVFFSGGSQVWVYNLRTDSWGFFYLYRNGTTALVSHRMLAGTPSARNDAIGGIAGDLANGGLCLVNFAAAGTGTDDVCLISSDAWTPDAAVTAYVTSNVYGDERTKTNFGRVTPISSNTFGNSFPAATGMTMTASFGDRPDSLTGASAVTSSTSAHRFDQTTSARFGKFKVSVTGAGYEIEDVIVDAKTAGTD